MENKLVTAQFDGGSRGNPGPAGIGIVLLDPDGTPLVTLGRYIGPATNNVAEYRALITALQEAKKLGIKKLLVRGDSELIIRQMRGEYRVKNPDLRILYDQAQDLVRQFGEIKIEHNLRHHNTLADKLANRAMDRRADVTDVEGDSVETAGTGESEVTSAGDKIACPRCGCVVEVKRPSPIRPHQLRPFVCQCGAAMHTPDADSK